MLLKNAGLKGQKTVFLLTDTQIKDEAFLEDLDSVLNTGEVPNLFAMDEKQEITEVGFHNFTEQTSCGLNSQTVTVSRPPDRTSHCPGWK